MFSSKNALSRLLLRTARVALLGEDKDVNGYVKKRKILSWDKFEHREVAEKILSRKLFPSEEVHHIDFVRSNNLPSNLCVMSKEDHKHYHNWHRWMEKNKPDVDLSIEYRKKHTQKKMEL